MSEDAAVIAALSQQIANSFFDGTYTLVQTVRMHWQRVRPEFGEVAPHGLKHAGPGGQIYLEESSLVLSTSACEAGVIDSCYLFVEEDLNDPETCSTPCQVDGDVLNSEFRPLNAELTAEIEHGLCRHFIRSPNDFFWLLAALQDPDGYVKHLKSAALRDLLSAAWPKARGEWI